MKIKKTLMNLKKNVPFIVVDHLQTHSIAILILKVSSSINPKNNKTSNLLIQFHDTCINVHVNIKIILHIFYKIVQL